MTENKRFKFICDDENCFFKDMDNVIDCYDVCNLLNKLHEENNAVKDIINELNDMDFYKDSALLDEYLGKIARAVGCEYE